MRSLDFPITTARLRLRPLGLEDVDALSAVYLHPLVMPWIGPRTREDVVREIGQQVDTRASGDVVLPPKPRKRS
jgi:RimJ/RimL family protein N-acetyltransferase